MTTHYFIDCGYSTQTKNKLQTDFLNYLKSLNGFLIESSEIESLKKQIFTKQKELNTLHFRCQSLNISFYNPVRSDSIRLSGFDVVNFYIRAAELQKLT